jgi:hypothetical protein
MQKRRRDSHIRVSKADRFIDHMYFIPEALHTIDETSIYPAFQWNFVLV